MLLYLTLDRIPSIVICILFDFLFHCNVDNGERPSYARRFSPPNTHAPCTETHVRTMLWMYKYNRPSLSTEKGMVNWGGSTGRITVYRQRRWNYDSFHFQCSLLHFLFTTTPERCCYYRLHGWIDSCLRFLFIQSLIHMIFHCSTILLYIYIIVLLYLLRVYSLV